LLQQSEAHIVLTSVGDDGLALLAARAVARAASLSLIATSRSRAAACAACNAESRSISKLSTTSAKVRSLSVKAATSLSLYPKQQHNDKTHLLILSMELDRATSADNHVPQRT
jgi:hypothetical protein